MSSDESELLGSNSGFRFSFIDDATTGFYQATPPRIYRYRSTIPHSDYPNSFAEWMDDPTNRFEHDLVNGRIAAQLENVRSVLYEDQSDNTEEMSKKKKKIADTKCRAIRFVVSPCCICMEDVKVGVKCDGCLQGMYCEPCFAKAGELQCCICRREFVK